MLTRSSCTYSIRFYLQALKSHNAAQSDAQQQQLQAQLATAVAACAALERQLLERAAELESLAHQHRDGTSSMASLKLEFDSMCSRAEAAEAQLSGVIAELQRSQSQACEESTSATVATEAAVAAALSCAREQHHAEMQARKFLLGNS